MSGYQHAVFGQVQVEFQRVSSCVRSRFVSQFGFFRIEARQAAMADHQRCGAIQRQQRYRLRAVIATAPARRHQYAAGDQRDCAYRTAVSKARGLRWRLNTIGHDWFCLLSEDWRTDGGAIS